MKVAPGFWPLPAEWSCAGARGGPGLALGRRRTCRAGFRRARGVVWPTCFWAYPAVQVGFWGSCRSTPSRRGFVRVLGTFARLGRPHPRVAPVNLPRVVYWLGEADFPLLICRRGPINRSNQCTSRFTRGRRTLSLSLRQSYCSKAFSVSIASQARATRSVGSQPTG
jgi:hypothetical protein